ncbi:phosphoadenosine phosphosulfate reductase family protein [Desulfovirgula thermocuniculi]|uniref:phosphoadenosine phosphosulfate reductase domain-containing protein n=1 Tax=Desulfovirgula thermocuniculi TaxID=348842 RepID=UPI00042003AF|nr:phosphoadenosine phosphosulfate reductase family protein [Desulfovirgula thermocuniculi]
MLPIIDKVILISIDNLRYDCVGYQPDKRELEKYGLLKYLDTPTLDAIAAESLCFTNCISTSTYTTAAHASVFTGLYPPRHGVRAFFHTKLHPDVTTMAEVFRRNGYRTICATDTPELFVPLDMGRGFDHLIVRNDAEVLRLLGSYRGYKLFLFWHTMDVHEPYFFSEAPPTQAYNDDYFNLMTDIYRFHGLSKVESKQPYTLWQNFVRTINWSRDHLLRLYVGGVRKFDRGRLRCFVDALKDGGYWDQSLVVIFSDHGEGRCFYHDPTYFAHGGELYDEVLRVPLIIKIPGEPHGVVDKLVSLVDIFPTLVEAADLKEKPVLSDGVSLIRSVARETAYAEVWQVKDAERFQSAAWELGEAYIRNQNQLAGNGRLIESTREKSAALSTKVASHEWLLLQRCLRTSTHKFILTGKPEDFQGPDLPVLSDEDYVGLLYRKILARFEDEEGLAQHVQALRKGNVSRQQLLKEFLRCEEYRSRPRIYLYDLEDDPGEENPLSLGDNFFLLTEGCRFLQEILALEARAVKTAPVFAEEKEKNMVLVTSIGSKKTFSVSHNLSEEEKKSLEIVRQAFELFGEKMAVAFTGGKDSTVLLHLVRRAFNGHIPFPVVNIDTSVKFPEVCVFRDRLQQEWKFDLRIFRNEEALKWLKIAQNPEECCYHLKTVPMKKAIEELGLKALFTGVRWDENPARANEDYFSKRNDPPHIRVHPLLHFTEQDIWSYIRKYKVPYCSLYDQGYRSLGCKPCTKPATEGGHERAGRAQDKERIMQRLRELGYF